MVSVSALLKHNPPHKDKLPSQVSREHWVSRAPISIQVKFFFFFPFNFRVSFGASYKAIFLQHCCSLRDRSPDLSWCLQLILLLSLLSHFPSFFLPFGDDFCVPDDAACPNHTSANQMTRMQMTPHSRLFFSQVKFPPKETTKPYLLALANMHTMFYECLSLMLFTS